MRDYQIITDTNSDLPKEYVVKKGLIQVPQYTLFEGKTYEGAEGISAADFYNSMAAGALPQSQAINPAVCEEKFKTALDAGKDVLYISFASTLSGSCATAQMTAQNLSEEYPDATVKVVDTLAATVGEGLLVMKAVALKEEGKSLEEVAQWIEDNKLKVYHGILVDDLKHLQRGGRVSKTTAVVGTLAGIKPIIKVDNEGKLVPGGKVRGRKKAISFLVDKIAAEITDKSIMALAHANCPDEVKSLADALREKVGVEEIMINDINPSIGVHTGSGALVVTYFAKER